MSGDAGMVVNVGMCKYMSVSVAAPKKQLHGGEVAWRNDEIGLQ